MITETGCWIWLGAVRRGTLGRGGGYGVLGILGLRKNQYAHRYAYELLKGPIPDGKQVDHLCRVRCCVNPAHLEVVTQRENILRGDGFSARFARQELCKRGHALTGENLDARVLALGGRECRKCQRVRREESLPRVRALERDRYDALKRHQKYLDMKARGTIKPMRHEA